jgi:uncharacterized protein with NRDE domain
MCLILFAYDSHPDYRLVLAANRDEFYDRPTAPAAFWEDSPDVLAGRDLRSGGTWMGVTRQGRVAAVTNFRDPAGQNPDAPSRGWLVSDFLQGRAGAREYLEQLASHSAEYNGFNLLLADATSLGYYSNRMQHPRLLGPGVYGLSNALLDAPWPKIVRGRAALADLLATGSGPSLEALFQLLADREVAGDEALPDTGIPREMERVLSPAFIASPRYGTRSSTVLLLDREGSVTLAERTFAPGAELHDEVHYRFTVSDSFHAAEDEGFAFTTP